MSWFLTGKSRAKVAAPGEPELSRMHGNTWLYDGSRQSKNRPILIDKSKKILHGNSYVKAILC